MIKNNLENRYDFAVSMKLLDFFTNSFEIVYCKINRLKNHEHFLVDDLSPRRGAAPITNKKRSLNII